MTAIKCDGCGAELVQLTVNRAKGQREHIIHGERVNNMVGGMVPDHEFDWCLKCSQAAFEAVRLLNGQDS